MRLSGAGGGGGGEVRQDGGCGMEGLGWGSWYGVRMGWRLMGWWGW